MQQRILEERKRLGMTQAQFAKSCGASTRSVASWEAGESKPTAQALAEMQSIGVDVIYILRGEKHLTEPKNLAQFEKVALSLPMHLPTVKRFFDLRKENIELATKILKDSNFYLEDGEIEFLVNFAESYDIPIMEICKFVFVIKRDSSQGNLKKAI